MVVRPKRGIFFFKVISIDEEQRTVSYPDLTCRGHRSGKHKIQKKTKQRGRGSVFRWLFMGISVRGGGFHFGAVFSSVCDEGVVFLLSPSV